MRHIFRFLYFMYIAGSVASTSHPPILHSQLVSFLLNGSMGRRKSWLPFSSGVLSNISSVGPLTPSCQVVVPSDQFNARIKSSGLGTLSFVAMVSS